MWKFLPGENFCRFCHQLSLAKFLSCEFLSRVNDYIEDMVTFTALAKIYSTKYFCNTKVSGVGKILSSENFHVYGIQNYRIFALLSACAYIPTGRKPALNSEVCLKRNSCIQIRMRTRGTTCSLKGVWPMLARRSFAFNTACRSARNGAYFLQNMRIEGRHSNFDTL